MLPFQRIQKKVLLPPRRVGLSKDGGDPGVGRMGQTGSRVASKIANSFTFHGSPRYIIFPEEKMCELCVKH